MDKRCGTCKFYEPFCGVCWNGSSPNCADFNRDDNVCDYWTQKADGSEEHEREN